MTDHGRIGCDRLRSRVMSGFTGSGYPKAVPLALAARIAAEHADGIEFRLPNDSAPIIREKINRQQEARMPEMQQDSEQRLRERAYLLWQQEGCPDGHADRHWQRARELEAEREASERRVDIEEEDSFPASDPPSRSVITGLA